MQTATTREVAPATILRTESHPAAVRARRLALASIRHAVLIVVAAAFLLPFIWMLGTSLKTNQQAIAYPPQWLPNPLHWRNYPDALDAAPILRYAANSARICLITIFGAIISNCLIAYGFARLEWKGRDAIFILVLATLMLPFQVTMIPLFLIFARIDWTNSILPLTVPAYFGNAFFIFLLRQFFLRIPRDYSDAARLEGAPELRILWDIIVPLSRPAIITVALFQFLASWNDFLGPLLYLNDERKFTLSLGLANMSSTYGLSQYGQIMAAATMTVGPVVVAFFLAQRYFIQGIATSGLKG